MKNERFFELFAEIDENLITRAEKNKASTKKTEFRWLHFGALAACLCLIIAAVVIAIMLQASPGAVSTPTGSIVDNTPTPSLTAEFDTSEPIGNSIIISNKISPSACPKYYGSDESISDSLISGEVIEVGVSVTARLIETLPDTYTFFDDWKQTEFRLLKMERVKQLDGYNIPQEFYYIVPVDFMTDYSVYDSFVIWGMGQYGYGYSVLYNDTKQCAEQLDKIIFGCAEYFFESLTINVMAFDNNGRFDIGLWNSTEAWKEHSIYAIEDIEDKYNSDYTVSQAEADVIADSAQKQGYVKTLNNLSDKSAEALKYIKSFKNGLYVTDSSGRKARWDNVILPFDRYINGFPTNEGGTIYSDSVKYSTARFTKEDEEKLPDLTSAYAAVINAFNNGEITPLHIKNYKSMTLEDYGIFGWYAKTADGVIGIVRVTWVYKSTGYPIYYDDMYYIIEYGSDECVPIARDALIKKLEGYETTYIYYGEYDENGKIIELYPIS